MGTTTSHAITIGLSRPLGTDASPLCLTLVRSQIVSAVLRRAAITRLTTECLIQVGPPTPDIAVVPSIAGLRACRPPAVAPTAAESARK